MTQQDKPDPGLPVDSPSISYWQEPPHKLSSIQSEQLPSSADVVIIGSGITGTSTAYHLLQQQPSLAVTILEARTITSGATGRNGGHILDVPFEDFDELKAHLGLEEARRVSKFRLGHLDALESLALSLGADKAKYTQVRRVDAVCAIFDPETWSVLCTRRENWLKEFPEFRDRCHEVTGPDEVEKTFGIKNASGALTMPAGAVWPYRLVTTVLEHLLSSNKHFTIEANTPATSITASTTASHPYAITTPRGTILATHVVHATNGHAAHLLPLLRSKIVPVRGQMTAQQPVPAMPRRGAANSWSLHYAGGDFDYMVQAPTSTGEFLLGGGLIRAVVDGRNVDIGCVDDAGTSELALAHLRGVLSKWFVHGEGAEVVRQWTGIMGFTSDDLPIVGRVPAALGSLAKVDAKVETGTSNGEWIAAGFCGHGMVYTWLSGRAIAAMVLARDGDDGLSGFPRKAFACSVERVKRLDEHVLKSFIPD